MQGIRIICFFIIHLLGFYWFGTAISICAGNGVCVGSDTGAYRQHACRNGFDFNFLKSCVGASGMISSPIHLDKGSIIPVHDSSP